MNYNYNNSKWKLGKKLMLVLLIISLLVSMIPVSGAASIPKVMIAFLEEGTGNSVVRWSVDGMTWQDSTSFPSDFAQGMTENTLDGLGLMADQYGALHVGMFNQPDGFNFVWGLGTDVWDQTDNQILATDPDSAPYGVGIGDGLWLVAYLRSEGSVGVSLYSTSDRRIVISDIGPTCTENADVYGRPAITEKDGEFLLAWLSGSSIYTSMGSVGDYGPTFDSNCNEVSLSDENNEYKQNFYSDIGLTRDRSKFYIAYTKETFCSSSGDDCLERTDVFMRSSSNGVTWSANSLIPLDVVEYNYLNIAAFPDGTLVAASIQQYFQDQTDAALFTPGSGWSSLDGSDVFGANSATPTHFSLIASYDTIDTGTNTTGANFQFLLLNMSVMASCMYLIRRSKHHLN